MVDTLKSAPHLGFFLFSDPGILNISIGTGEVIMSKIIFNEYQRRTLEANPNVKTVSDRTIQYTPEFKVKAVNENLQGKGPAQIFAENGFDLTVIGSDKPKETLKRWRKTFRLYGEEGFWEERRGKGSTGRPSTQELSAEQKLEKAEARIKYLEAENELLKKLEALERQAKKRS